MNLSYKNRFHLSIQAEPKMQRSVPAFGGPGLRQAK